MKTVIKHISLILMAFVFTIFSPAMAGNINGDPIEPVSKEEVKQMTDEESELRVQLLEQRLNQIKTIDNSELTKEERKALKSEVKDIKKELKVHDSVVYISGGAILLAAVLLILFL